ncbi:pentatricopeptide repeat-containing protein At1g18485-like [Wolffia australiana]
MEIGAVSLSSLLPLQRKDTHLSRPPPSSPSCNSNLSRPTARTKLETLCKNGDLHGAFLLLQSSPRHRRCSQSLQTFLLACNDLQLGRQAHKLISSEGLTENPLIIANLLSMYSACGSPDSSLAVFKAVQTRTLVLWNALISGFSRNRQWEKALQSFQSMIISAEFYPDGFTLPSVLRACAGILALEEGRQVQAMAAKLGLGADVFVCNSLVSLYCRCGQLDDALQMFDTMPVRNLVSWNSIIQGCSEAGMAENCIDFFERLVLGEDNLCPDDATMIAVLPVCASKGWIELGRGVHGLALKLQLLRLTCVCNSLLDMYCKCGELQEAEVLFRVLQNKNRVTCNVMLGGLARAREAHKALDLLRAMAMDGENVDGVTLLNVISIASIHAMIGTLMELHGYAIRAGLVSAELVFNALVAAYCRCGYTMAAEKLFFSSLGTRKTVSSWNALIGGHTRTDDSQRALDLHLQMVSSGLQPDEFGVGSVLSACAHRRDLRRGRSAHGFALRSSLEDDAFIQVSLLSLYAQCGELASAEVIFHGMKEKRSIAWNAIVSGLAQSRHPAKALEYFRQIHQPSAIAIAAAFSAAGQLSALKLGQELLCYAMKLGLCDEEDVFVASSVISMFSKSGAIDDAHRFFDCMEKKMKGKSVVLWNAMIMGYAVHGRGPEAVELLRRMEKEEIIEPDSCTFIGVLAACSHAGMVETGVQLFEEMKRKYSLKPKVEHLACMADMLARAGRVKEAAAITVEPDTQMLSLLLGGCRIHGKFEIGDEIAGRLMAMEPEKPEHYVSVSNLLAAEGRWDEVGRLRKTMKELGLRKEAGCSWIHVDGKVYEFIAGDL